MKNKKLKITLVVALVLVIISIMTVAYAESSFTFTVNPTEVTTEAGNTITVDLGIADIDQSTDGINSIQGDLAYDENIFESVEISTSENNWSVTLNQLNESSRKGRFAIVNLGAVKNTQKVAQLKATIKSTANVSSATIYLNNVSSSYGTTETAKTNKTITVKISNPGNAANTLVQGNNIVNGVVNQNTVTGGSKLPQTGISDWIVIAILIASLAAVIGYIRYKRIDK